VKMMISFAILAVSYPGFAMATTSTSFLQKTEIGMHEARPYAATPNGAGIKNSSVANSAMLRKRKLGGSGLLSVQMHEVRDEASTLVNTMASTPAQRYLAGLTCWAIWAMLMFLVYMFAYHPEHEMSLVADEDADPAHIFDNEHFHCFHNSQDCMSSLFCAPLRWADTMHMANIMTYNMAFEVFIIFSLLNVITGTYILNGLFTTTIMMYGRHEIRRVLGLPRGDCEASLFDCCFVLLCPCCAIAQEARVIRDAVKASLQVTSERDAKLPAALAEPQVKPSSAKRCCWALK